MEVGRDLSGRTGATAGLQVDVEILLGEVPVAGWLGLLDDQGPFGLGKLPAGLAILVGGVGHSLAHAAPMLRSLSDTRSRSPSVSGALPGNIATVVIS